MDNGQVSGHAEIRTKDKKTVLSVASALSLSLSLLSCSVEYPITINQTLLVSLLFLCFFVHSNSPFFPFLFWLEKVFRKIALKNLNILNVTFLLVFSGKVVTLTSLQGHCYSLFKNYKENYCSTTNSPCFQFSFVLRNRLLLYLTAN